MITLAAWLADNPLAFCCEVDIARGSRMVSSDRVGVGAWMELYKLADYVVSSQASGQKWLVPRPAEVHHVD